MTVFQSENVRSGGRSVFWVVWPRVRRFPYRRAWQIIKPAAPLMVVVGAGIVSGYVARYSWDFLPSFDAGPPLPPGDPAAAPFDPASNLRDCGHIAMFAASALLAYCCGIGAVGFCATAIRTFFSPREKE